MFENAASTKMVHICEFTADLIKNNKLKLDPGRNDHWKPTFHDSCNTSRGMGLLEEPRYILNNVCNSFYEMPDNTIKERTFCCGSGAGLGSNENMEMRLRGGFPRANAVKHVQEQFGVNLLTCICAIDKATLPPLMEYWVPGMEVGGVHELVGNALVMKGKKERTTDLRGTPVTGEEHWNEGFSAVLISVGAHEGIRLPIPGANLDGVLINTHFLRDVRLGKYAGKDEG